jgi:hypothetical protein
LAVAGVGGARAWAALSDRRRERAHASLADLRASGVVPSCGVGQLHRARCASCTLPTADTTQAAASLSYILSCTGTYIVAEPVRLDRQVVGYRAMWARTIARAA